MVINVTKVNNNSIKIRHITMFLNKLFKNIHEVDIVKYKTYTIIEMRDESGRHITAAKYPYNIKDKSSLGFYYKKYNYTLLPLKNKKFLLKIGTGTNLPIRDLFSVLR